MTELELKLTRQLQEQQILYERSLKDLSESFLEQMGKTEEILKEKELSLSSILEEIRILPQTGLKDLELGLSKLSEKLSDMETREEKLLERLNQLLIEL